MRFKACICWLVGNCRWSPAHSFSMFKGDVGKGLGDKDWGDKEDLLGMQSLSWLKFRSIWAALSSVFETLELLPGDQLAKGDKCWDSGIGLVIICWGCDQIMVRTPPTSPIITVGVCLTGVLLWTGLVGPWSIGAGVAKLPPIISGFIPLILECLSHSWFCECWGWFIITPVHLVVVVEDGDMDPWQVITWERMLGEETGNCTIKGLCLITGLWAGLPGELCGLGGYKEGLAVDAGLTGGLWDLLTGRVRITLVIPPPSKTPDSPSRHIFSKVAWVGCICSGVESGLGGLTMASDILGEVGQMMSGDQMLVSATDSPRTGQRDCLEEISNSCLF